VASATLASEARNQPITRVTHMLLSINETKFLGPVTKGRSETEDV